MIVQPTPFTLRKYGLSLEEWKVMLADQGGVCAVCLYDPPSGRLVIDHEHVGKWKAMPPEKRKLFVRGLLCWTCNRHTLARGATEFKLHRAAEYLHRYHLRKLL